MLRNDQIQAGLISYLKANITIVATLVSYDSSASEIREDQWKGSDFIYPNIRLRLITNVPLGNEQCNTSQITLSVLIFAEAQSSLEADQIAGIINNELNGMSFESNNIAFSLRITNLVPAIAIDLRTWRAECLMSGI